MAFRIAVVEATPAYVDAAAQIWAETTAARDGDDEIAPLDQSRPLIQSVLDSSPRSVLLVADDDGTTVGFVATEPWAEDGSIAEVRYVGVSPRAWGGGVGRHLMAAMPDALLLQGFGWVLLMVYTDNTRAVRLYESLGWRAHGSPVPHPRSGKFEQQYRLDLRS